MAGLGEVPGQQAAAAAELDDHAAAGTNWLEPMALLACTGSRRPDEAGATMSMALRNVLDRARLPREPRVLPASFRGWGGRRLYDETGDIEEVAHRLGVVTLDSARRVIDLPDPEPDTPPPHRGIP